MYLELVFRKTDETPWGFRLAGGSDCDLPLFVSKVNEQSPAELIGLREDDLVVRINESSTVNLTHLQAHDLIQKTPNDFVLGIRRGELFHANGLENVKEQLQFTLESQQIEESIIELGPEDNLAGLEQIIKPEVQSATSNNTQKQWSTFLQKPSNPLPILRKPSQEETQVEPYRVVIKKQRKCRANTQKHVDFSSTERQENPEDGSEDVKIESEQEDLEVEVQISELEETEIQFENASEEEEQNLNVIEPIQPQSSVDLDSEEASVSLTLEEQLAQVQKQLQALAQLPSTIQETLDAVTQQLKKIVVEKLHYEESPEASEEEQPPRTPPPPLEEETVLEEPEPETEEEMLLEQEPQELEVQEEEKEEEVAKTPEPTEEELEAQRQEQAKLAKQLKLEQNLFKEMDVSRGPPQPIQRPIILPGGRRWSHPDDACPKLRHPPKMSDEKIASTIETYSEIQTLNESWPWADEPKPVYKQKGIQKGTIKYQPPPKNMDYLQKSDVYKLVHDMEPQVRGISSRAERVLTSDDYKL